jgi:hypothetical protein
VVIDCDAGEQLAQPLAQQSRRHAPPDGKGRDRSRRRGRVQVMTGRPERRTGDELPAVRCWSGSTAVARAVERRRGTARWSVVRGGRSRPPVDRPPASGRGQSRTHANLDYRYDFAARPPHKPSVVNASKAPSPASPREEG